MKVTLELDNLENIVQTTLEKKSWKCCKRTDC